MRVILLLFFSILVLAPTEAQISKKLDKLWKQADEILTDNGLTRDDVTTGLKQALETGVRKGADQASVLNGFYKNPDIKIPFPKNAKKVSKALKKVGMEKQVDEFVKTLNRSAELAAKEAKPIFVDAIKDISMDEAWTILTGGDKQGATKYLQEKTTEQLVMKISPIVDEKLKSTNATKYYKELIDTYNKLPFVSKQDSDLTRYATNRTIKGLFLLVGQEELKIRENPGARSSDLLKKVFQLQD